MSLKSKVLQDLMEKLHLMPETMGEMEKKDDEKDDKDAIKEPSTMDAVALLIGKGKDNKDDEEEEDEDE